MKDLFLSITDILKKCQSLSNDFNEAILQAKKSIENADKIYKKSKETEEKYCQLLEDIQKRENAVKEIEGYVTLKESSIKAYDNMIALNEKLDKERELFEKEKKDSLDKIHKLNEKYENDSEVLNTSWNRYHKDVAELEEDKKTYKAKILSEVTGGKK